MNFIRDFLYQHAVELVGKLVSSGFSNGEAQRFLKEIPEQVLTVISRPDYSPLSNDHVINGLDIEGVAERAHIEPSLANRGLKTILPAVLEFFRESQSGWQSDVRFPTVH